MFEQLLNPLAYLRMRPSGGDQQKLLVDFVLPGIFSLGILLLLYFVSRYAPVNKFGDKGLLSSISQFIQTLPGFYMAGLAAVATLNRPALDDHLRNPEVTIPERVNGIIDIVPLTRRRFVCILFAFLTVESIVVVMLGVFGNVFAEPMRLVFPPSWHAPISQLFVALFSFLFGQLLSVTLWALYYLSNRIFRP